MSKKIIFYYQTLSSLKPVLYENTPLTHIHLASVHFGTDENDQPYIHLNDDCIFSDKFDSIWTELRQAHTLGVKIILMIGGAGCAYSELFQNYQKYDTYYNLLYTFLKSKPFISGVDLDIEEPCAIENIQKLIKQIIKDFGKKYTITVVPVQGSIENDVPGMSGFIYKDLLQSDVGSYISYINGQFYSDFSLDAYTRVVSNGYDPTKIVMGMEYEQDSSELSTIVKKYNNDFGGVYYWEYNYAKPTPLQWLQNIENIYTENVVTNDLYTECNIS